MAEQNRGERLRQFMQWRQQAGGGRLNQFQGGQFDGGPGFGRFQGGMGRRQFGGGMGRFGRFQGGMGPGFGQGGDEAGDLQAMDAEQRAQYRQQLEFRIDWLEKRLTQAVQELEELDALEATEATEMPPSDPFAVEAKPDAEANEGKLE